MELSEFLAARLAEDEAAANEVHLPRTCGCVDRDGEFDADPVWCSCDGPARVLAEVAAKRAILAEHRQGDNASVFCWRCDPGSDMGYGANYPCSTVRALAAVYNDHPDYDPAWVPEEATQAAPKSRPAVICVPVLPAPSVTPPGHDEEQRPGSGEHGHGSGHGGADLAG